MTVAQTLEEVMAQWGKSHEPTIKPELVRQRGTKGNTKWRMQLVEVWPQEMRFGHSDLDSRVQWAMEVLESWKSARRTSFDMWEFTTKREAEKFVTLYNLKWA